jgi:hypothetical protein
MGLISASVPNSTEYRFEFDKPFFELLPSTTGSLSKRGLKVFSPLYFGCLKKVIF